MARAERAGAAGAQQERWRLTVAGTVQGVGFRPFVYRLATRLGLDGRVWNADAGVIIEVQGGVEALAAFEANLQKEAPPLAR
ncbi:MAG: acylphosphatase, partial [Clostridia bacterium]|nr:acylphosphatase [Clostridia bacterium]